MKANRVTRHTALDGKDIFVFRLKKADRSEVLISNYGALILSYKIKQSANSWNDIVLGFDEPEQYRERFYLENYPLFGAAVGRYGNRIKDGKMRIGDQQFQLPLNRGTDHLHGGITGFDKKIWELISFDEAENRLELQLTSPDGEEGYPGTVKVLIRFWLNEKSELSHEYEATTDQPTAINLTHHSYFNLDNGKGQIGNHFLKIYASNILEQDSNYTTTGKLLPVENTRYDFRDFRSIASGWGEKREYDQSFVLDNQDPGLKLAAEAYSSESKLKLELLTTEPLVHFYTGSGIAAFRGKNQTIYGRSSGFCLETQVHPNAINIPHFPNTVLKPGEVYRHKTVYRPVQIEEK